MYGVGHASYVQSPDGKEYWIDYHSKTLREPGWKDRKVFMQKFDFNDDGDPVFGADEKAFRRNLYRERRRCQLPGRDIYESCL